MSSDSLLERKIKISKRIVELLRSAHGNDKLISSPNAPPKETPSLVLDLFIRGAMTHVRWESSGKFWRCHWICPTYEALTGSDSVIDARIIRLTKKQNNSRLESRGIQAATTDVPSMILWWNSVGMVHLVLSPHPWEHVPIRMNYIIHHLRTETHG